MGADEENRLKPTDDEIDGGIVKLGTGPEPTFHERKHRAETSKMLIRMLVWVMAITAVVYPVSILALSLAGFNDSVVEMKGLFVVWLPAITALVGHGTGYYFAQEKA